MVEFIPLYDLRAFMNYWKEFSKGLERVLYYAEGDTSMERIYNEVMAQMLTPWVIMLDKENIGFFTSRVDYTPTTKRIFTIVHMYLVNGVPSQAWVEGLDKFEKIAMSPPFNCEVMRFWSTRSGWENKLGWKQGYTEFYKQLKREGE
jgi:hypothetical protein